MMEDLGELVVCMAEEEVADKEDYMKELVVEEAHMEEMVDDLELLDMVIRILQQHWVEKLELILLLGPMWLCLMAYI